MLTLEDWERSPYKDEQRIYGDTGFIFPKGTYYINSCTSGKSRQETHWPLKCIISINEYDNKLVVEVSGRFKWWITNHTQQLHDTEDISGQRRIW